MVVIGSRLEAVRYKQSFDKYIREKGYPIKSLVAYSGSVKHEGGQFAASCFQICHVA
jgi:type I restriction enzyme, R subunit